MKSIKNITQWVQAHDGTVLAIWSDVPVKKDISTKGKTRVCWPAATVNSHDVFVCKQPHVNHDLARENGVYIYASALRPTQVPFETQKKFLEKYSSEFFEGGSE